MHLIRNGKPAAQIVIPLNPAPVEDHAAQELRRFVHKISGAELPIGCAPAKDRANIFLGSAASSRGCDLSEQTLGFDGYLVKTAGPDLILAGAKPYSCLYAVYHLLERHLGCGFFEDGDQVPQRTTLELGAINDLEKPRFAWRVIAMFHTPAYSGLRWYTEAEWKQWFDWVIKKRFNLCETNWLAQYSGVAALAAGKLGIPIDLTPWQRAHLATMRRVFDYARMGGVRFVYEIAHHFPWLTSEPGSMPYYDRVQTEEFIRRYEEKTGEKIPLLPYQWWGPTYCCMDPRHAVTKKFIAACAQAAGEEMGADHWYHINMVAEGEWCSANKEETDRVTYGLLMDLIGAVKDGDPQAFIYTRPPFAYAKTFAAQKRAIQDAGLPIIADFWLHIPARTPDFQLNNYYWGLPWATGMIIGCGKHTNPWGDIDTALDHAQALLADPRAGQCRGFFMAGEFNHRQYLLTELFAALAWDPARVDKNTFLRQWTLRRYGPDAGRALFAATQGIAETLLSRENMDLTNRPLYRDWLGGYLPGLTARSVKRTLSYLPRLRGVLATMLAENERLQASPLYRFDLVDYGRTYLGAIFNYRLAQARQALRAQDRPAFERQAAGVEEVMRFMARYCSAHELFRLQTHDERAGRHPPILPGQANAQSNWITWTALISPTIRDLLDYCAEDFAELIEHYFRPRVRLYLQKIRELLEKGQNISDETNIPCRISDWATPQGTLRWSPYGPPCEPELKGEDLQLANRIIDAGTVSGRFDFYTGPIAPLVRELLERFPVPPDLPQILAEPDPQLQAAPGRQADGQPGDVLQGFHPPQMVEQVRIPPELNYYVSVKKVSEEYNLARGGVTVYQVDVSDWLSLTRLADEQSERGRHAVAVFSFNALERTWILRYDPGSEQTFAALAIDPAIAQN